MLTETAGKIDHAIPPLVGGAQPHQNRWDYDVAFSRNIGLVSTAEQQTLRDSHVAIAGMGGVGGVHLATLARLGIGRFTIADPDDFDVANFNRQYGASCATLGENKAQVMGEIARQINPEAEVTIYRERVTAENVDQFLTDVDVVIDGLDFFAIPARRLVFRAAAQKRIWAVTAGPIGFSTAWLTFDPDGMSFDDYFDLHDEQQPLDQLVAFAVGLTPQATHRNYIDLTKVDVTKQVGPSSSLACQLASGVTASEVIKILTNSGTLCPAPCYHQFDPYRGKLAQGKLRFGNRGISQRLKRALMKRFAKKRLLV
jgi:molybdopterin/thiamine biosynthesis adenylyltransferase